MSSETRTPTAVVESYFEAVATNDLESLGALVSPDFMQFPPIEGARQDRDTFMAEWRTRISEDPVNSLIFERSNRLSETVETGHRSGQWVHEWGTYRRSDNKLAFKLHASFRVLGDCITEIHAYFDRLDIVTQAGFTLSEPQ